MKFLKKIIGLLKNLFSKKIVTISPKKNVGWVLISYIIYPFLKKNKDTISFSHTNDWECRQMVKTFLDLGYGVDVINWDNCSFLPKKKYKVFIDIHSNMERLSQHLDKDCIKVLHITGAHWLFQNTSEYERLYNLQRRRAVTLLPRRIVPTSLGIEYADVALMLGNDATLKTFSYANKPIYKIPLPSTVVFDYPVSKNFSSCKRNYLWLGSMGMVHKGLDLVLETFKEMPDYNLFVCGPVGSEKDFEKEFFKELYETPNIKTIGWVDVDSKKFLEIANNCVALIYPSCSEGQSGSVITCMHAGIIPVTSYQSGVNVLDFGYILRENSKEEIENIVEIISNLSESDLKERSQKTWKYARENHSRERFIKEYNKFIREVLKI